MNTPRVDSHQIETFMVYKTIHFLNLHDNPIDLSPFLLKLDQLENSTPVQICCFDLYLETEML